MTQQPDMSEMDEYYNETRKPLFNLPTSKFGRFGCGVLLVLWFIFLTLPCAMIWLAVGNTITVPHANIPEPELHPRLEIQLIMQIDNRGLKFTTTSISESDTLNICVENNINYFLWESDSSATSAIYCQCYQRESTESEWNFVQQLESVCSP